MLKISVIAKPNAKKTRACAIEAALAEYFHIPQSRVEIIQGYRSKQKIVRLELP